MTTLTAGSRTIGYRRAGAGPPLVVLNGFAATKDDWDPVFLDALARDRELVLLDHRGMGESSDDGEAFTIEDLAADVAEAIAALDLGRVAVLGWSMGGFVALSLAASEPAAVSKLVLLSTHGGGPDAVLADEATRERLRDTSGTPREQAARLISLLFPPERAAEIDAKFGEVVAAAKAMLPHDVVARQWAAMEGWERRDGAAEAVAGISAPALVATGIEDVVIPPANSLALVSAMDGAWLARFPDCGHGFMADHPEALGRLVEAFMQIPDNELRM